MMPPTTPVTRPLLLLANARVTEKKKEKKHPSPSPFLGVAVSPSTKKKTTLHRSFTLRREEEEDMATITPADAKPSRGSKRRQAPAADAVGAEKKAKKKKADPPAPDVEGEKKDDARPATFAGLSPQQFQGLDKFLKAVKDSKMLHELTGEDIINSMGRSFSAAKSGSNLTWNDKYSVWCLGQVSSNRVLTSSMGSSGNYITASDDQCKLPAVFRAKSKEKAFTVLQLDGDPAFDNPKTRELYQSVVDRQTEAVNSAARIAADRINKGGHGWHNEDTPFAYNPGPSGSSISARKFQAPVFTRARDSKAEAGEDCPQVVRDAIAEIKQGSGLPADAVRRIESVCEFPDQNGYWVVPNAKPEVLDFDPVTRKVTKRPYGADRTIPPGTVVGVLMVPNFSRGPAPKKDANGNLPSLQGLFPKFGMEAVVAFGAPVPPEAAKRAEVPKDCTPW